MLKQRGKFRIQFMAICAAVVVGVLASVTPSLAAEKSNGANTLKISPVRSDIEVEAGESKVVNTTITNLTDAPITVRPVTNDFVAGDENGTPSLILDADKFAPTHSLKRFMSQLSDVTIPAKQSKTVPVTITVPKSAQAGGYFGAVRFAPTNPDDGGQVNLSASVASLILLTVPGDTVEKLSLTDFDIQQDGKTGSFFNSSNDLQAYIRFKNEGNVQLGPIGKISVEKGGEVVYETDFNNKELRDLVLPDSARRWSVPLKKIGSFGKYNVTATFTYGKKNQTIEVTRSFWVVPVPVIIATVVLLLILIGLTVGIWAFLKSYKKRVISKHDKENKS